MASNDGNATLDQRTAEIEARCRRAFDGPGPILIHTPGKVGSMTVLRALERLGLPQPLFHIHSLREGCVRDDCERLRAHGHDIPDDLLESEALIRHLRERPDVPMKIVTLVRDPIARELSLLFEDRVRRTQLADATGEVDAERAIAHLRDLVANSPHFPQNPAWLDIEIRDLFGIDVLAEPFPHDKGWKTYRRDNCDMLLIRMEDLSTVGPSAVADFIGLPAPLPMPLDNVRTSTAYAIVKAMLRFPPDVLKKAYGTPHVEHLYDQSHLDRFLRRWSRRPVAETIAADEQATIKDDLRSAWNVISDLRVKYDDLHEHAKARLEANGRLAAELDLFRQDREELLGVNMRLATELELFGKDRDTLISTSEKQAAEMNRFRAELDLFHKDRQALLENNVRLAEQTAALRVELDARGKVIDNLLREARSEKAA